MCVCVCVSVCVRVCECVCERDGGGEGCALCECMNACGYVYTQKAERFTIIGEVVCLI